MTTAKMTLAAFAIACVGGCASIPDGCDSYIRRNAGTLEIAGLKIPVGTAVPVELGKAVWTPVQVQTFSDFVLKIDQYRSAQCSVLSGLLKLNPQPTQDIVAIYREIGQSNKAILSLKEAIDKGVDPNKVNEEAAKAAAIPLTPVNKPGISYDPNLMKDIENLISERERNFPSLLQISDAVREAMKPPLGVTARSPTGARTSLNSVTAVPVKIAVGEFAMGQFVLTSTMKNTIRSKVVSHLADSSEVSVAIDLVGYADTSGDYKFNLWLGLKRAESVKKEILELTANAKNISLFRVVASGGITQTENPRRVDVFISRT